MSELQVPGWPLLEIVLTDEGGATVDGNPVTAAAGQDPRTAALAKAAEKAQRVGRPVRVHLTDLEGLKHVLAVAPNGDETVLEPPKGDRRKKSKKNKKAEQTPPRAAAPGRRARDEVKLDDLLAVQPGGPAPEAELPVPDPVAPPVGDPFAAALEANDWSAAVGHLAKLRDAGAPADRISELEAQMSVVRRDNVAATVQYTALALARLGSHGPEHPDTQRAADHAQQAWLRITGTGQAERAVQAGKALLALRELVPGESGNIAQIRSRLARFYLG
ncbi:hypothetical protein [Kitasatospora kifunensis]|uniref:Uncharacterized protein n=1 Tax=Kitasatospora kifunensis TaxID=58351 RepID=A0A7W7RBS1_KITKI|nr:hypothetical protein [Kitasatospora kifunensis]MBB4929058.1 hypothetical protein [Kitasatospora kifunensis]